jgi:hypothetical protein
LQLYLLQKTEDKMMKKWKCKNCKIVKPYFFLMLALLLFSGILSAQMKEGKSYPKPEGVKHLLFYVQRSLNANTLIYTLNLNEKGEINMIEPVKIHWVNYEKDGEIEPLNYVQRKYAYGLDVRVLDEDKKSFVLNFVSYKKKPIYLIKSPVDHKYHAYYQIKNELIYLSKIFVQIEGGAFWTPKIKYLEVSGHDLKNEPVVEKVIP